MRSEANERVETIGEHEISVGIGLTNNLCPINSNAFRSINIYSNVTVSKNTADNCDVACAMKKDIF